MKKNRNFTWLILGIITILIGILVPIFAFNQSVYYEFEKDTHAGNVTFYVTITSKEEIEKVHYATVNLGYENGEDREYEVYYVKSGKSDNKFIYEFKLVETENWVFVDEIESIKLTTAKGEIVVNEKVGLGTRIPIAVFACIIGGFMIFVNFFNNSSKNRTIEIKEIIASSSYNNNNDEVLSENLNEENQEIQNNTTEIKEESAQPENKIEQTKACEYCGTLADINDKVCASCGAKFKKK